MVMPPVNTIVVQTLLLPPERRSEEALGQAQRLLTKALGPVNDALAGRQYLIDQFSGADIMLGHASFMSRRLGCVGDDMPHLQAYIERLESLPAFIKGIET
jgi:glutathione S-transferase